MSPESSHGDNVPATGRSSLPKQTCNLRHYEPGSIGVPPPVDLLYSDTNEIYEK